MTTVYGPFISRKQAKEQGLKHYFTGKPCKWGHIALRNTSHCQCSECNAFHCSNYYAKNSDAQIARQKAYVAKNSDRVRAYQKSFRENNKEKLSEQKRVYNWKNRDQLRLTKRKWVEKNRSHVNEKARSDYHSKPRRRISMTLRNATLS